MRVNSQALEAFSQSSVNRAAQAKATESVRAPDKVQAPSSSEAALVAISDEARQMALASQATESTDGADKVAALKDAIEKGTFQLNSQMVAQRIIDRLA